MIDNFLSLYDFLEIKKVIGGHQFPWCFYKNVVPEKNSSDDSKEIFNSFFVHQFYENGSSISPYTQCLFPLFTKLNVLSLIAVRANLYSPNKELVVHGMHKDFEFPEETLSKITTCVYYLDDSDGKTVFEDGFEVLSKQNRVAIFNGNTLHSSTNCTNNKMRLIVNVNYISR